MAANRTRAGGITTTERLDPFFFATKMEFESWLEANHASEPELLVGFKRKATGLPTMTWKESVDAALCFGWIDGVRRGVDDESYSIRFTPRRKRSIWSRVNIARVQALMAEGRMRPAGQLAFEERDASRAEKYSYEREQASLSPAQESAFRREPNAWEFFERQAPSYRKAAIWWVVSARQEETRAKRLAKLIANSGDNRRLGMLAPNR
ncbi:MAG TPA: YdeI/OmpD-associated family protein [Chloroflexota bacterium]|nr:YdeI/OmpD-associated family protein [Chloroflexota bacterium]